METNAPYCEKSVLSVASLCESEQVRAESVKSVCKRLAHLYDEGEARAIVRMLLEDAFGLSYTDICCGAVERFTAEERARLETLMARLEQGEPVQYVIGEAEFCGRRFKVAPGVLIPRPETARLIELTQKEIDNSMISIMSTSSTTSTSSALPESFSILDIGTGSGCIAITLALQNPQAEVEAWDISPAALAIAEENASRLGATVNLKLQDALAPNSSLLIPNYSLIISNPPYICQKEAAQMEPNVLEHEPHQALFVPDNDPLLFYKAIAEYGTTALKPGGTLAFEINPEYAGELEAMLESKGYEEIKAEEDQFGKPRFTFARWRSEVSKSRNLEASTISTFSKLSIISIILALFCLTASSQTSSSPDWMQTLQQLVEMEEMSEEEIENTAEIIQNLQESPININQATKEQLEQLPFLSDIQIENILYHVYKYRQMRSPNELIDIASLDYQRRQLLRSVIYCGPPEEKKYRWNLDTIAKHGKHEAIASLKIPLYSRKGDGGNYLGDKYKHWLRYTFKYSDRVQIGLSAAKDSGEPFLKHANKYGYDYYGGYAMLNKAGPFERIILGRFKASFGMGLVAGQSFQLGKLTQTTTLGRTTQGIRPHGSRSEADYLQGAAATFKLSKSLNATAFASYRAMDATLNKDGTGSAATIISDGYHRTEAEMDKKFNLHATEAGANIQYTKDRFRLGITAIHTHLDRILMPKTSASYRRFYPSGRDFTNVGLSYGYVSHKIAVIGETATDKNGLIATLNSAQWQLSSRLKLSAIQRYYNYRYASLRANAFSDAGHVRNETGLFVGATYTPLNNLHIQTYADFAYHPWQRYLVSDASYGQDFLLDAAYHKKVWAFGARYRLRNKQKDLEDGDAVRLEYNKEHRFRAFAERAIGSEWKAKAQFDYAHSVFDHRSQGYMLSALLYYKGTRATVQGALHYFKTDDYNSRLYTYESGTLYSFSCPMLYGHGIRYTLNVKSKQWNRLQMIAKLSVNNYFDRSEISSGNQLIRHSSQPDLELQAKIKIAK